MSVVAYEGIQYALVLSDADESYKACKKCDLFNKPCEQIDEDFLCYEGVNERKFYIFKELV